MDILVSSLCFQFCGQCFSKNGFAMLLCFLVLRYNSSKRCTHSSGAYGIKKKKEVPFLEFFDVKHDIIEKMFDYHLAL